MGEKQDKDFADDVKINKYKLPEECETHASKYFYWASKLAEAKTSLDAEKNSLNIISAEREMYIRNNWDTKYANYGKQTEGAIKSVLELDKKVIESKEAVIKLQESINYLQAAVSALDHRKSELDNLTTLFVKGFYAAPNGGRREGATESVEREIRDSLRKGGKK